MTNALALPHALLVLAIGAVPAVAMNCEDLAQLNLADGRVTSAIAVPSPFTVAATSVFPAITAAVPFCRVSATLTPTPDSDIKIEVWLPVADRWTGAFEGIGNGGMGGSIPLFGLAAAVSRGQAAAGTDTGHADDKARPAAFALGHPEKIIDYGYRSTHLTAVVGKAIAAAYYGKPARHAYFFGCSQGGQEAMMEAQRFPDDYDGIVAGDPDWQQTHHEVGAHLWVMSTLYATPGSAISPAKAKLIGDAVNKACDQLDGVVDGVLEDPRRCTFDPAALQCTEADSDDCLTVAQVEAVRKLWSGPNALAGAGYYPGFMRGGEATLWPGWISAKSAEWSPHGYLGLAFFKYFVYADPLWDFRTFDYQTDPAEIDRKFAAALNAEDPDLKPFRDHGGKLIQYHGYSDPDVPPQLSIDYHDKVVRALGGSDIDSFYRLFMVPGMGHCAGGPGPNSFDMMAALKAWVETGKAPDQVIATKYVDDRPTLGVLRTRPLCVYPKVARYSGSGSTDDARNFTCATEDAAPAPSTRGQ